jgi:hypothetical protein
MYKTQGNNIQNNSLNDPVHLIPQITDPRPDMANDSSDWVRFLKTCYNISPDLYYLLHGFRCMGTRLLRGQHSYILRPEITGQGWENTAHYERVRDKELEPWRGQVVEVLRGLM